MDTDRNLLFGVLALQADLITQDQFVQACTLWTTRKDMSLADLLLEQGWLTAADRTAVDRLLECKLKKHQGDARASLAEVATNQVQRLLGVLNDPDLQRSLDQLSHHDGHILLSTVTSLPQTRERYTLTRLHASGGIGRVWLARDSSLGREVALKELLPERIDNPAFWSRFLKEAQITGQLEHPAIVPVYELSRQSDNQQPFYTMRFVKGRTLTEAVQAYHHKRKAGQAGPLDLSGLLNAFVGVCQAVAYAHSRGVIHRDLKGQNVVLGDYGEVILLDWGLAKLVDRPEEDTAALSVVLNPEEKPEATVQGQVIGTPAYMAPEQAEGRLELIDRRTDVYGLGAILYEILTGQPPFTGTDTEDVLRKVREEEPLPPRTLCAGVSAALEAVCLRALAKKPTARYSTAAEVAQELQRWLAGEPVAAYREPWTFRARRWLGRHRTLVATALATVLVATVSLAAATVLLTAANDRERKAKELALLREQEAQDERAIAEQQREEATNQRYQAAENFQLARQAVEEYLTKVTENPRLREHDLEDLRKGLLQTAVQFLEQFVRQRTDDPDLQGQRGKAYMRLARITQETASKPEAIKLSQQALAIFDRLVHDHPTVPAYQSDLAGSYSNLGDLYSTTGLPDKAEAYQRKSIEILDQLTAGHPAVPDHQFALAKAYNNLAILYQRTGRSDQAEEVFRKVVSIFDRLVREQPTVADYRSALGKSYENLGNLHFVAGRFDQAEIAYQKTLDIRSGLVQEHPFVLDYQNALALSQANLGNLFAATGRMDQAEEACHKAQAAFEQLARRHPTMAQYQSDLAGSHAALGFVYKAKGRSDEAAAAYRTEMGIRERLALEHPTFAPFAVYLSESYANMGDLMRDQAEPQAALEWYTRVVRTLEDVFQKDQRNAQARRYLVSAHRRRAETLTALGRHPDALQDWDRALGIDNGQIRELLKIGRAGSRIRQGDYAAGLAEANAVVGQAAKDQPIDEEMLYNLAAVHAHAVAAVLKDAKLPSRDREQLAERYTGRAVELLNQIQARGFLKSPANLQRLEKEPAFELLRSRQPFQEFLDNVGKKLQNGTH